MSNLLEKVFDLPKIVYNGKLSFSKNASVKAVFLVYVCDIINFFEEDKEFCRGFSTEPLARAWCIEKIEYPQQVMRLRLSSNWYYAIVRVILDKIGSSPFYYPFAFYQAGKEIDREELPKPPIENLFWSFKRQDIEANKFDRKLKRLVVLRRIFREEEPSGIFLRLIQNLADETDCDVKKIQGVIEELVKEEEEF